MAPTQLSQPVVDILDTVKDGVDSSDTSTVQSISNTRPEQNSTGTGLMQLSAEVRMQIIDLFLDTDVLVMDAEISGESWARCRESIEVPELWRPFEALMMTCRQLRLECLDILGQRTIYQLSCKPYTMLPPQIRAVGRGKTKVWFQNRLGDFIWEMPRLMGLEFLLPIRLFELEMHSTYHKQDRRCFPVLLSVLCDHMPNLLSFRFKTSHSDDSQGWRREEVEKTKL